MLRKRSTHSLFLIPLPVSLNIHQPVIWLVFRAEVVLAGGVDAAAEFPLMNGCQKKQFKRRRAGCLRHLTQPVKVARVFDGICAVG